MKELSDLTKISTGNISDLENNRTLPSTKALMSLSSVLNCSIDEMIFGKTSSNIESHENGEFSDEECQLVYDWRELSDMQKGEIKGEIKQMLKHNQAENTKRGGATG